MAKDRDHDKNNGDKDGKDGSNDREAEQWRIAYRQILATTDGLGLNLEKPRLQRYLQRLFREIDSLPAITTPEPRSLSNAFIEPEFIWWRSRAFDRFVELTATGKNQDEYIADAKSVLDPGYEQISLKTEEVLKLFSSPARFLIRGDPGQGKSVFLKYVALQMALSGHIPVFIELRELNQHYHTLSEIIRKKLETIKVLESGELKELIRHHKLILILDGLDEILDTNVRLDFIDEILRTLSGVWYEVPVLVSTRHEQTKQLADFEDLEMQPLTLEKAAAIADRVSGGDMDFVNAFRTTYFKKLNTHDESVEDAENGSNNLFSTPLMIELLYVTQRFDRPLERLGPFLKQAIRYLHWTHDWQKGGFVRPAYESFHDVSHQHFMQQLCLAVYLTYKDEFYQVEFSNLIEHAKSATNEYFRSRASSDRLRITAEVGAIRDGLVNIVGIVRAKGSIHRFSHPLFIEYYVSEYLLTHSTRLNLMQKMKLIKLIRKGWTYRIATSLDEQKFNRDIICPVTRQVMKHIEAADAPNDQLLTVVNRLCISEDGQSAFLDTDGTDEFQEIVWSLLINCLRCETGAAVADGATIDAFLSSLTSALGKVPPRRLCLEDLEDDVLDQLGLARHVEPILAQLAEVRRSSCESKAPRVLNVPEYDEGSGMRRRNRSVLV